MDYALHYNRLIEKAKGRHLDGYIERHHIVPHCLGGSNKKENLVELTAKEHFIAHILLAKMYPTHKGLTRSFFLMSARGGNKKGSTYAAMRLHWSELNRGVKRGPRSQETKDKISKAHLGMKMVYSTEGRTRHAESNKKKASAETRKKMSDAKRGKPQDPEKQAKRLEALRAKMASPEFRQKMAETMKKRWASGEVPNRKKSVVSSSTDTR